LGNIIGEEIADDWPGEPKEIRKWTAVFNVRLYKQKLFRY